MDSSFIFTTYLINDYVSSILRKNTAITSLVVKYDLVVKHKLVKFPSDYAQTVENCLLVNIASAFELYKTLVKQEYKTEVLYTNKRAAEKEC